MDRMLTLFAPLPAGFTCVSQAIFRRFSLYGERVGGLSVVCEDAEIAARPPDS